MVTLPVLASGCITTLAAVVALMPSAVTRDGAALLRKVPSMTSHEPAVLRVSRVLAVA